MLCKAVVVHRSASQLLFKQIISVPLRRANSNATIQQLRTPVGPMTIVSPRAWDSTAICLSSSWEMHFLHKACSREFSASTASLLCCTRSQCCLVSLPWRSGEEEIFVVYITGPYVQVGRDCCYQAGPKTRSNPPVLWRGDASRCWATRVIQVGLDDHQHQ